MAEIIAFSDKHPDCFLLFPHKDYFSAYFLQSFEISIFYINTTILCDDIKGFSSRLSLSRLSDGRLDLLIEIIIPTNAELLRTDCQWRGKRTFSFLLLSWYSNIICDVSLKYLCDTTEKKSKSRQIKFGDSLPQVDTQESC